MKTHVWLGALLITAGLGLITAVVMAHGDLIKAVAMIFLGLVLGLVGTDVNSGTVRYGFGIPPLWDGLGFLPVVMGLFGINEIMNNLEQPQSRNLLTAKIGNLWPSRAEFQAAWPASVRAPCLDRYLEFCRAGARPSRRLPRIPWKKRYRSIGRSVSARSE